MATVSLVNLGNLEINNPWAGGPEYLSAASACAWIPGSRPRKKGNLYVVGDDQVAVVKYSFSQHDLMRALYGKYDDVVNLLDAGGEAQRILALQMPDELSERQSLKPDLEAGTVITAEHFEDIKDDEVRTVMEQRFRYGLLLVIGSGGLNWSMQRLRSTGVVYPLDRHGNIVAMPSPVSFEGLHQYLESQVKGDLNLEGVCVHGEELILAQRGNSLYDGDRPAPNALIRLSLTEVLRSLYTDLKVDQCELLGIEELELGYLPTDIDGQRVNVKLDITDIDSVTDYPGGMLIATAAAEGLDGTPAAGHIAGSVLVCIDKGQIVETVQLYGPRYKLEGVDGVYNATSDRIDVLAVPDPDEDITGMLFGTTIDC